MREGPQNTPVPRSPCPAPTDLAQAVSEGADEELLAHVRICPSCAPAWYEQHALRSLGARLPFVPPSTERRQQMRDELLAQVAGARVERRRRRTFPVGAVAITGGLALAAAAVLFVVTRGPTAATPGTSPTIAQPSRATIEAATGARFAQISGPPHEVYRLYEGTVRFTVEHAVSADDTFKVVTGVGEVEVRGTVFETTAANDRLIKVSVQRGKVVVRRSTPPNAGAPASAPSPDPEIALEAGNDWQRPDGAGVDDTASLDTFAPAPVDTPAPRRARPAARALGPARPADAATRAFAEGMDFGISDPNRAAAAYERAAALSPNTSLAEDATYRRAVVLNRSGESARAYEALKAFLDRFPRSAWAGEASVQLAWLLLDRGEFQGATFRFRAGLGDPSPRVRRSAQAGLDAVTAAEARQRR